MKIQLAIASIVVVVLTVVPAILDGQRRFRWGIDSEVQTLKEKLDSFPTQIGNWEMVTKIPLDETSRNQLTPVTVINRVYFNSARKLSVNVLLLLGPVGPTAAHTPDICFNSSDYRKLGDRQVLSCASETGSDSKYYQTKFLSRDVNRSGLMSNYAWTVDGTWHAPNKTRTFFAKDRYLLKIQLAMKFENRAAMDDDLELEEFTAGIERAIRNHVF